MGVRGWTAVRALPYLEASAKDQLRDAVKTYMAGLDKSLDATPFGVPVEKAGWRALVITVRALASPVVQGLQTKPRLYVPVLARSLASTCTQIRPCPGQ